MLETGPVQQTLPILSMNYEKVYNSAGLISQHLQATDVDNFLKEKAWRTFRARIHFLIKAKKPNPKH